MTRIVVIGYSGQVATELREQQLANGWSMVALGRERLDLARINQCGPIIAAHEPDILINAAAYTAVDRSESEEELATLINGFAPGELARIAANLGIPFLHVSTDYVFDGTSKRSWSEDDTPEPINAYGRSKLAGERAVLDSAALAIILRTSWIFSAHGANFVKTMLRLGTERDEISVVADQQGCPTGAHDIAGVLLSIAAKLMESPRAGGSGLYHYAGAPPTSWAGFAEAIFAQADWLPTPPKIRAITTAQYPTPAQRPLNSVLDCSRIARDFGLDQPDWRLSLKRTLDALGPTGTKGSIS